MDLGGYRLQSDYNKSMYDIGDWSTREQTARSAMGGLGGLLGGWLATALLSAALPPAGLALAIRSPSIL